MLQFRTRQEINSRLLPGYFTALSQHLQRFFLSEPPQRMLRQPNLNLPMLVVHPLPQPRLQMRRPSRQLVLEQRLRPELAQQDPWVQVVQHDGGLTEF